MKWLFKAQKTVKTKELEYLATLKNQLKYGKKS